jgi:hypothetical protein
MLTLAAPLSREVGEGLPKVREFWWELSLGSYRGIGAEFIRRGIATPVREVGGQLSGDGGRSGANDLAIVLNHHATP